MDIVANGVADRTILKGSDAKATGPHGSFYFHEFLQAIQKLGSNTVEWTGTTGIGDTLDPSVKDAVLAIQNADPKYPNVEDPHKLFPGVFDGETAETKPNFVNLYQKVFDLIQANRKKITSSGVSSDFTKDDFDTAVSRAQDAGEGMHQGRIADADYTEIEKVNQMMIQRNFPVSLVTEKMSALDGQMTWEQANSEASIEAAEKQYPGKGGAKLKACFQAWSKNTAGSIKDQKSEANHRAALKFAQTCDSRIHGDENC
ncbi:hypothetical protein N7486_005561 [Penicillium sp. IBT 16267x]|nr:hypothetical protein N7486_005561 [Penicillium sp. IBT 16267x]